MVPGRSLANCRLTRVQTRRVFTQEGWRERCTAGRMEGAVCGRENGGNGVRQGEWRERCTAGRMEGRVYGREDRGTVYGREDGENDQVEGLRVLSVLRVCMCFDGVELARTCIVFIFACMHVRACVRAPKFSSTPFPPPSTLCPTSCLTSPVSLLNGTDRHFPFLHPSPIHHQPTSSKLDASPCFVQLRGEGQLQV